MPFSRPLIVSRVFTPIARIWSNITMDIVGGVYQPARISASEGDRVFNVWIREDGMRIDRILLTRSNTFPIATIRWHRALPDCMLLLQRTANR